MAVQYGNLGLVYEKRRELDRAEEMHRRRSRYSKRSAAPSVKQVQEWLDGLNKPP